MPRDAQDARDKARLSEMLAEVARRKVEPAIIPSHMAAHFEMMKEAEVTKNQRRERLTNLYTNSVNYEDLGFGLAALIDYVILLEDAVSPTRGDIPRMSWDI